VLLPNNVQEATYNIYSKLKIIVRKGTIGKAEILRGIFPLQASYRLYIKAENTAGQQEFLNK